MLIYTNTFNVNDKRLGKHLSRISHENNPVKHNPRMTTNCIITFRISKARGFSRCKMVLRRCRK